MGAILAGLVLILDTGAFAQEEPGEEEGWEEASAARSPSRPPSRGDVDLEMLQGVGMLSGDGIIQGSGPVSLTELDLHLKYRRGGLRMRFPVDLSHRHTLGYDLVESRGNAAIQARLEGTVAWLEAEGGITGVLRPGWPDPYQPLADGTLEPTDRRSYLAPSAGGEVGLEPVDGHRLTVSYAYKSYDYVNDPDFDPEAEPTHLTPGDQHRHTGEVAWRSDLGDVRLEAGATAEHRSYTDRYARDAGTGLTHAGVGGDPANPLQTILDVEPGMQVRVQIGGGPVELRGGYGVEIVTDPYQGYYSYLGHHPSLGLDFEAEDGPQVALRGDVYLRRYGPDSYAEGATHPALEYGDRRVDNRVKGSADVDVPVHAHWSVAAEGEFLLRRTNFPSYEPGVYPATRTYDIDWNYTNWMAILGVRYRL